MLAGCVVSQQQQSSSSSSGISSNPKRKSEIIIQTHTAIAMPGRRKQKTKQGVEGGVGSQSQCAAALKELSRTRRKSLNKQQEEEEYTTRRSVASSAWPFLPALPIEMQMSLAQLRPQPRPEFPLPNESFHLQVVSVLVAVSFFCSPLLLSLSSFMFLRFFWCISSKWQVKWQACRLLHAIFFFLHFLCISETSLIRFSPAVFSASPQFSFFLFQFSVMKT